MGEIIEFKSRQRDVGYIVLHCPVCDGIRFNIIYSHERAYHRCLDCDTMFPKWSQEE